MMKQEPGEEATMSSNTPSRSLQEVPSSSHPPNHTPDGSATPSQEGGSREISCAPTREPVDRLSTALSIQSRGITSVRTPDKEPPKSENDSKHSDGKNPRTSSEPLQASKNAQAVVKAEPASDSSSANPSGQTETAPTNEAHAKQEKENTEPELLKSDSNKAQSITFDYLQTVISTGSLERLESGIKIAATIIDELKAPLGDAKVDESDCSWYKSILKMQTQVKLSRVVLAIAGNTGAGKSSSINAMLFLERFLPTNGVRACTAAVTEIAWNGSDDPQEYFRAEVEFISRENWKHELGILLGDLVGENCELSKDYLNEETEAGVAYAKLKAVYPDKTRTKEMVAQCLAQELLEVPEVQKLLGKTKKINAPDAETFRGALQRYLDSNEKIGTAKREKKSMAFWPLVKVVRVYCKADVLSTGLVIADLPGVQDANAARSAVADKYLAECSALCVVSPITRAADDKVAKNLLSKSFRRQLKMDGIYSNVIFICTKTDDVSVRESLDSFDSGPIQATIAREKEIKEALHVETEALGELKTQQNLTEVREEQLSRDHVVWKRLQKRAEKGQEVHAPHKTPQKRKRPTQPITRRKGARPTLADSDSDEDEQIEQPLTLDQIRTEMNRFDEELEQANDELAQLQEQVTAVKGRISGLGIEKEGIISQRVALCIKMRNDYAREAIKADFAAGIREIDEDDAAGEDGQDFDPSKLKRDYNEVARSLPVFCISNRAFEQVWEGAQIESPIQGFRTLDETEIPQLKEHAKGLTENMRLLKSKTFLNDFMALLTSLLLWVESEGSGLNLRIEMGDKEQGYEIKHLNVSLDTLDRDLKDASQSLVMHLLQAVDQGVTKQSSTAVKAGTSAVISVARSWGEKTSEGGVHWGTYKAICRRSGEKTKAKTARNFNEEILEPYQQKIATDWERIFAEEVPRILDDFVRECGKLLQEFHHAMSGRPELERCKAVPLALLGQQIRSHVHAIQDLGATSKLSIQGQQREAGRLFLPHIKMTMQKGYNDCAAVTGKGCFLNMKKIMENYVEKVRTKLYRNAAAKVRTELERGFRDVGSDATAKLREIVSTMGKDYKSVILGSEIIEASHMARDHIRQLLPTVDSRFRDVLGFEIRNADSKDVPLAQFAASMVNTQAL